ncbi:MAG: molybdopterin dinucleotide binding domain-containing protein [Promethearchaeota archaeon]
MGLREYLYPELKLRLVIARALDVDLALLGQGTESKEYKQVAARISLCPRDAHRLGLEEGKTVQITSKTGQVIVHVKVDEATPEGLAVMSPGPWTNALLPAKLPHQGINITLKPIKKTATSLDKLP